MHFDVVPMIMAEIEYGSKICRERKCHGSHVPPDVIMETQPRLVDGK